MVPRKTGIIVNISSAGGLTYAMNASYGIGKAAQDRMAMDMNMELKGTGVTALAVRYAALRPFFHRSNFFGRSTGKDAVRRTLVVWPGGVKTELSTEHILNSER